MNENCKKKWAICLGLVASSSAFNYAFGNEQQTKMNILTIIVDQHFAQVMSNNNCKWVKTPVMDGLAQNGVKFSKATTAFPLCTPARAAMMTGQRPFKVYQNPTKFPSIAKLLKKQNYQTAYYGKWHVGNKEFYDKDKWHNFDIFNGLKEIDNDVSSATVKYLDGYKNCNSKKPFFMVASFTNPHDTCEGARKIGGWKIPRAIDFTRGGYEARLDVADEFLPPLPFNFAKTDILPSVMQAQEPTKGSNKLSIRPTGDWNKRDWRLLRYNYGKMVETVDGHVGKIIDALKSNGLNKNTVVIFISDHGDGNGAHQFNQKHNFYNEAMNVPLIIVDPKGQKNVVSEQLSNASMDWFSTVLDYAGYDEKFLKDNYEGLSLKKVVENNAKLPRDFVVGEFIRDAQELGTRRIDKNSQEFKRINKYKNAVGRMILDQNWKYIVYDQGELKEALFDLKNDAGELKNLAYNEKYKAQLLKMRKKLKQHIVRAKDNFKAPF